MTETTPAMTGLRGLGSDLSVQHTNDDAHLSKLSCVNLGYYQDPFLKFFSRRAARRSPLINRGYFSRYAALKQLLDCFLEQCSRQSGVRPQVLSLGAGFDTTWFRLQAAGRAPFKYVEVDFPEVTKKKAAAVANTPELWQLLGSARPAVADVEQGRLVTDAYALLPADIRDADALAELLREAGCEMGQPTYVLAECVLIYMEPAESLALVRSLGAMLTTAAFVVYEQIRPDDAFGRQMLMNLERRGCPLKGIRATPDLATQRTRFTSNGWGRADAADLDTIYRIQLDGCEKQRIERLELFDEFEEWYLFQEHYAIAYGVNDKAGLLGDFGFQQPGSQAPGPPLPKSNDPG